MDRNVIDISARISLVATEDGGRTSPLNPDYSYRPNHNFFETNSDRLCRGEITVPRGSSTMPGETFEAMVKLIVWPELKDQIVAGRKWRIQEGAKVVAHGEVLKVHSTSKL